MGSPEADDEARGTADRVARRSYGKLVAFLAARTQDVAAAEDALSDAFASALVDWPLKGCPSNPEAWLLTVARRKLIDQHVCSDVEGRTRGFRSVHLRIVNRPDHVSERSGEGAERRERFLASCGRARVDHDGHEDGLAVLLRGDERQRRRL